MRRVPRGLADQGRFDQSWLGDGLHIRQIRAAHPPAEVSFGLGSTQLTARIADTRLYP